MFRPAFRRIAVAALGLSLLVTTPALAERGFRAGPDAKVAAGPLINAPLENIADVLSLTDEQMAALDAIRARHAEATAGTREAIVAIRAEMKALYTSGTAPSEEALRELASRMSQAQYRLTRATRGARVAARDLLNLEQRSVARARWRESRD